MDTEIVNVILKRDWFDYIIFGVSLLTLVGLGCYVYLTHRLAKAAKQQHEEAVKQTVSLAEQLKNSNEQLIIARGRHKEERNREFYNTLPQFIFDAVTHTECEGIFTFNIEIQKYSVKNIHFIKEGKSNSNFVIQFKKDVYWQTLDCLQPNDPVTVEIQCSLPRARGEQPLLITFEYETISNFKAQTCFQLTLKDPRKHEPSKSPNVAFISSPHLIYEFSKFIYPELVSNTQLDIEVV